MLPLIPAPITSQPHDVADRGDVKNAGAV